MSVNDRLMKALEEYGGLTLNERIYHFLGSLGFTNSLSDRLAKYESGRYRGYRALIEDFGRNSQPETDLENLIRTLYGNGEQGAMYIPKPQVLGQQVLWQDVEGTVPVRADGDPVGLMLDLSGNGNHATQETSAARPIYRTDGVLHWVEFDGVDDRLGFDPINAETIFFSCESATSTQGVLGGGSNAGEAGYVAVMADGVRYRSNNTTTLTLPSQTAGNKVVTIHNSSEGLTRAWGNGQKSADELQKERISSIRYISPGTTDYYLGEFYGAILHTQDVVNHREGVEMYLASKSGVTLL